VTASDWPPVVEAEDEGGISQCTAIVSPAATTVPDPLLCSSVADYRRLHRLRLSRIRHTEHPRQLRGGRMGILAESVSHRPILGVRR